MSENSDSEIRCSHCGMPVAPGAAVCCSCGKELPLRVGPTIVTPEAEKANGARTERELSPPDPDAFPPYMWRVNAAVILVICLIGILWNFTHYRPDRMALLQDMMERALDDWRNEASTNWRRKPHIPRPDPSKHVDVVLIVADDPRLEARADTLVQAIGVTVDRTTRLRWNSAERELREETLGRAPPRPTLFVEMDVRNGVLFRMGYWVPDLSGNPGRDYEWVQAQNLFSLYRTPLINFVVLALGSAGARFLTIVVWRARQERRYRVHQRHLAAQRFEERAQLEEARRLMSAGELAKALVVLNRLLEVNPAYTEAQELKRLITQTEEAGAGTIMHSYLRARCQDAGPPPEVLLYLKVFGTPYAYRADPGAPVVSLGRQRAKAQSSAGSGNDLVVRVPSSDAASLRISRRHLEIHRIDRDFFVIDKSGGRTKLNGRKLIPEEPLAIRTGDRLMIAGVVTLEVMIRPRLAAEGRRLLCLDGPLRTNAGIVMEATLGDMVTEAIDE